MFQFLLEPEIPLLTVTRTGFWSLETVAAYESVLRRELAELQRHGPSTAFIIDIRSTGAQAKDVATELRAMVGRLGPLHAGRTAVVTSSGIAKLQAMRVADVNAEVFTSMSQARAWVMPAKHGVSENIIYDDPSDAEAEGNSVHIQGPSDVDISLTPIAALETAKRIGDAAVEALLEKAAKPD